MYSRDQDVNRSSLSEELYLMIVDAHRESCLERIKSNERGWKSKFVPNSLVSVTLQRSGDEGTKGQEDAWNVASFVLKFLDTGYSKAGCVCVVHVEFDPRTEQPLVAFCNAEAPDEFSFLIEAVNSNYRDEMSKGNFWSLQKFVVEIFAKVEQSVSAHPERLFQVDNRCKVVSWIMAKLNQGGDAYVAGIDMMLNFLCMACNSKSRRALLCDPFPGFRFIEETSRELQTQDSFTEIDLLSRALNNIPPLLSIVKSKGNSLLESPTASLKLLQWVLCLGVNLVLERSLDWNQSGDKRDGSCVTFKLNGVYESDLIRCGSRTKRVFHGTGGESVHSIIQRGLRPMNDNPRMVRNGQAFGKGTVS